MCFWYCFKGGVLSDRVNIAIKDKIAFVTLNRPDKHNSMDFEMLKAVISAQRTLKKNIEIRAIILRGEGPSFCSGLDIKTLTKDKKQLFTLYLRLWQPWRNVLQKWSMGWRDIAVPVIAVVHGNCFGAGLQLALGADIRIVTPDAKLSLMEAKWGLIPDMGGIALIRELMSIDMAKELTMTGRIISGSDAKEMGLVTHINEDPLSKAMELGQEIITRSPDSVGASKKLLQNSWDKEEGAALRQERLWQRKLILGKNFRIAVKNALGKEADEVPFPDRKIF